MLALFGALGLALCPVNTATKPVEPLTEEPEPTPDPEEEDWKQKFQELLDKVGISNIISYCLTGGTMVGLIVTFAKYKAAKYKTTMQVSDEIKEQAIKEFTDYVVKYYDTALDKLSKGQVIIEKNMTVLVNAFVLAQDSTAKGRAALLEYLNKNIEKKDEETQEKIEEQQEKTEEQIKKEDEVIKKIQKEEEPQPEPVD